MAKWKTVVFFDFNETFTHTHTHTHHTQMNTNAWPSHAFDEHDKRMTNTHDDHKCMTRWTTNACCMKGFTHCVLWRLINRLVVKPGSHFDHCFGGMLLRLEKWYNSMTFWSNVTLYDNCKSVFGTVYLEQWFTFVEYTPSASSSSSSVNSRGRGMVGMAGEWIDGSIEIKNNVEKHEGDSDLKDGANCTRVVTVWVLCSYHISHNYLRHNTSTTLVKYVTVLHKSGVSLCRMLVLLIFSKNRTIASDTGQIGQFSYWLFYGIIWS